MGIIDNFEAMLAKDPDNVLLRFSLGNEYLKINEPAKAVPHLRRTVELDPGYSAAWKLLGKALTTVEDREAAIEAYEKGIAAAEVKGDKQAVKEMGVFLRRLQRES